MDLSGIISISGKPGLFKVVARSKNNIIVESLTEKKRFPAYSTDRISALDDISIYTYEEDVPLVDIYTSIAEKEEGKSTLSHKDSFQKLENYLKEILPEYDEDRVYKSDIKKLFQWYNIIQKAGYVTLEKKEEEKKEEKNEKASPKKTAKVKEPAKKPAKKTPSKQSSAKQSTAKKKSSKETKKPTTKEKK